MDKKNKHFMQTNRRSFIRNAAIGTMAALTIPEIAANAFAEGGGSRISLNNNDVVLFQGDSITDSGRDKKQTLPNNTSCMGNGYAQVAASALLLDHADKSLQIYNKGISG